MGVSSALGKEPIQGMFFKRLEETSLRLWVPNLSHMFTSDKDSETYKFLGQSPALTEWIGARRKEEPKLYSFSIVNRKYQASVEFSKDDMRREKVNQIQVRIRDLASRAAILPQTVVSTLITNGATAGNTAYDSQLFFADRSSLTTGGGIDNDLTYAVASAGAPTTDEVKTGVLDAIEALLGATDDQGEPMNEFATQWAVMVAPGIWAALVGALKDQFTSSGVSNTLSAIQSSGFTITPIANPRLTGTTMYIFRTDSDVKPFIWQDEVRVELDGLTAGSDYEWHNDAHVFGTKRIGYGGYGEPAMAARMVET